MLYSSLFHLFEPFPRFLASLTLISYPASLDSFIWLSHSSFSRLYRIASHETGSHRMETLQLRCASLRNHLGKNKTVHTCTYNIMYLKKRKRFREKNKNLKKKRIYTEMWWSWKRKKEENEKRKKANRIIFNDTCAVTGKRNALLWSGNLTAINLL